MTADPLFADIATLDACVRPGSPAIDAGKSTGIDHDYLGIPRPQSRTYDIGACEFSGD